MNAIGAIKGTPEQIKLQRIWHETDMEVKKNILFQGHVEDSIKGTSVYLDGEPIFPEMKEKKKARMPSNVIVTYTAASKLQFEHDETIAVLNFANAESPGGCVKLGAKTQEEDLCRSSTLYHVLDTKDNQKRFYAPHRKMNKYGLGTSDIIYTPRIVVFRYGYPSYEYKTPDEFTFVDVITCAAPRFKSAKEFHENVTTTALYECHFNRGKRIIEAAINNKAKILVLGAFGCGDYHNDPRIVATAYRDLMLSYSHYFKIVEFAVYCSGKSKKNFNVFKKIILD